MTPKSCRPQVSLKSCGPASLWLGGLLALLLTLSGCATRKEIVGFQEDTRRIRSDLDTVKVRQDSMKTAMDSIAVQIRDLRAKSEYGSSSLQEKVETLAARLDDILSRMDRTVAPLEEYLRKQQESDTTGKAGLGTDYFDAAQRDLSMGNYDLAEDGFLQFLQANPKSDLADDARYGLAETYYGRKMYSHEPDGRQGSGSDAQAGIVTAGHGRTARCAAHVGRFGADVSALGRSEGGAAAPERTQE